MKRVGSRHFTGRAKPRWLQCSSVIEKTTSTQSWLVPVSRGELLRLTTATVRCVPAWSPEGKRIAFFSSGGEDRAPRFYVMRSMAVNRKKFPNCPRPCRPDGCPTDRMWCCATCFLIRRLAAAALISRLSTRNPSGERIQR